MKTAPLTGAHRDHSSLRLLGSDLGQSAQTSTRAPLASARDAGEAFQQTVSAQPPRRSRSSRRYFGRLTATAGCVWLALILQGCSTTDPDTIDRDFGGSVRRMVEAQKVYPEYGPRQAATMDGAKAQKVLEAYREDIAKPQKTEQPLQVIIGGGK